MTNQKTFPQREKTVRFNKECEYHQDQNSNFFLGGVGNVEDKIISEE